MSKEVRGGKKVKDVRGGGCHWRWGWGLGGLEEPEEHKEEQAGTKCSGSVRDTPTSAPGLGNKKNCVRVAGQGERSTDLAEREGLTLT